MLDLIPGIRTTASALSAERLRADVVSMNIANAMSGRGADGTIYQRQQVVFETLMSQQGAGASGGAAPASELSAKVELDPHPPRWVPDPSNPGRMIEVPDINIHREMVDMMLSGRAYEANLAVAKNARSMALQTLSLGKRA